MKDIAKECGVSSATVSYVLNDVPNQSISADTKKRILHVANMVGYVSSASARALATGKTNNFGVYVPHIGNSTHKQRLLQALAEEAETAGYHLVLLTGKCLKQQVTNVDAVFAIDISEDDFRILGDNSFVPLLYLDGQIQNDLFYCVTFDAMKIRQQAMEQYGCSKVILVCDEIKSRDYKVYLLDCFDAVVDADAVASISLDADTALLTNPTLDYGAYAQAAVDAQIILQHIQPVGVCEIFIISTAVLVGALHHLAYTLLLTTGTGHYRFHSFLKRCIDEQADMLILIIF